MEKKQTMESKGKKNARRVEKEDKNLDVKTRGSKDLTTSKLKTTVDSFSLHVINPI